MYHIQYLYLMEIQSNLELGNREDPQDTYITAGSKPVIAAKRWSQLSDINNGSDDSY